jgi:hypothetical protein
MENKERLEKNSEAIIHLQRYISSQSMKIKNLEEVDKEFIEKQIKSLETLKSSMEKAPAFKQQLIKKMIIYITISVVPLLFSGIVLFFTPSALLTILMILNIFLANYNIISGLKKLIHLNSMIKNYNINKTDDSIRLCEALLENVNATIKELEKDVESSKKSVNDILLESKNIRIAENQKANLEERTDLEDELEKGTQFTKKIK